MAPFCFAEGTEGRMAGKMEGTVVIVAGGPMGDPAYLRAELEACRPKAVIAADGGARHLLAAGTVPDLIVGDMDSLSPEERAVFERRGSRIEIFPAAKDETDTQIALLKALAMPCREIRIYGALGGRLDHTLANCSLLVLAAERGVAARLLDEDCEVFVVTSQRGIEGRKGQTVSVFPLSSRVTGIELTGFDFPLRGAVMAPGNPYGVSNRLSGPQGTIRVAEGILLVIRYFRTDLR